MDHSSSASVGRPDIVQKVTRRLIPFVGVSCHLIAYIDRQNVSFAKLQMVGDLGLSEYAYGLGASLFFIGYFLFEVPSNVIMEKVGARRWFARIMISLGLATIALAYTQNTAMFYTLRFLLGACEGGFFSRRPVPADDLVPVQLSRQDGGLVHAVQRYRQRRRRADRRHAARPRWSARAEGLAVGLHGHRYPGGCHRVHYALLSRDRPQTAHFLHPEEKDWLRQTLAAEDRAMQKTSHENALRPCSMAASF